MAIVGKWAFIIGLIIAVLAGFGLSFTWFAWVLAVLGLIAGFLNVTKDEVNTFLLAAIGLLIASTAISVIPYIGTIGTRIFTNLCVFIAAAVLVVALRSLFATTRA